MTVQAMKVFCRGMKSAFVLEKVEGDIDPQEDNPVVSFASFRDTSFGLDELSVFGR